MFDINGSEFLIIAVIALILIGPERLPEYVRGLRAVVKRVRALVTDSKSMLKDELGPGVDLKTFDPRQYDPRRIVREALFEGPDAADFSAFGGPAAAAGAAGVGVAGAGAAAGASAAGFGAQGEVPMSLEEQAAIAADPNSLAARKARRARERREAALANQPVPFDPEAT